MIKMAIFKMMLVLIYSGLMLNHIKGWYYCLTSKDFSSQRTPADTWTDVFHVSYSWWFVHSAILFLNAFFLFCGMFILPLVMGVWK